MRTLVRFSAAGLIWCVAALVQAEDVATLVKQLKSADTDARRAAAKQLAEMGAEAKPAASALLAAVKQDKDLFVRRFSVQALGQIEADPKTTVPALAPLVKDEHKELAEAAIDALGNMGPMAVQPLIDVLKSKTADTKKKKGDNTPDPGAMLRGKAATSLGKIGSASKAAVPALIDALKDNSIRADAATALGNIGPEAKEAVSALQDALGAKGAKKDQGFKQAAQTAIKKIQGKT